MRFVDKEGGQNKFPRVLKDDNRQDWEYFLKKNKISS
jgi:hypothetical protein